MKPKSNKVTAIFLLVHDNALFFLSEIIEKIMNRGYTIKEIEMITKEASLALFVSNSIQYPKVHCKKQIPLKLIKNHFGNFII
jgi:hypothetical protein